MFLCHPLKSKVKLLGKILSTSYMGHTYEWSNDQYIIEISFGFIRSNTKDNIFLTKDISNVLHHNIPNI